MNTIITITAATQEGVVTRVYLNLPEYEAVIRFLNRYGGVMNYELHTITFIDELQLIGGQLVAPPYVGGQF